MSDDQITTLSPELSHRLYHYLYPQGMLNTELSKSKFFEKFKFLQPFPSTIGFRTIRTDTNIIEVVDEFLGTVQYFALIRDDIDCLTIDSVFSITLPEKGLVINFPEWISMGYITDKELAEFRPHPPITVTGDPDAVVTLLLLL